MSQDIRDFKWFVLDDSDEIVALFDDEKDAELFRDAVNAKCEGGDMYRVEEGYFNFDSSCWISV